MPEAAPLRSEELPAPPDVRTLSGVSDARDGGSDSDASVHSEGGALSDLVRRARALNEKKPTGLVLEAPDYARKQELDHLGRPDGTFQTRQRALREDVARKRREAAEAALAGTSAAARLVLAPKPDERRWWNAPRGKSVAHEKDAAARWDAIEAAREAAAARAAAAANRAEAAAVKRAATAAEQAAAAAPNTLPQKKPAGAWKNARAVMHAAAAFRLAPAAVAPVDEAAGCPEGAAVVQPLPGDAGHAEL